MDEKDKKNLLMALKVGMNIQQTTLILDQNQCEFLYEKLEKVLKEEK